MVLDMKFVIALIAFAAFANAGGINNKDAPITEKDIDKLIIDVHNYMEIQMKIHSPLHIESTQKIYFNHKNVMGEFVLNDLNVQAGEMVAGGLRESATLSENDLSIDIVYMRSGITSYGKIHLVGSANGKYFNETGTFSSKWDNVGVLMSLQFLFDEKSIKVEKLSFVDTSNGNSSSVSIQGVKIAEITREDLEAAVLLSLDEYRHELINELDAYSSQLIPFVNKYLLQSITPRELYNKLRQAVSSS